jgi:hypothetical protein
MPTDNIVLKEKSTYELIKEMNDMIKEIDQIFRIDNLK